MAPRCVLLAWRLAWAPQLHATSKGAISSVDAFGAWIQRPSMRRLMTQRVDAALPRFRASLALQIFGLIACRGIDPDARVFVVVRGFLSAKVGTIWLLMTLLVLRGELAVVGLRHMGGKWKKIPVVLSDS